VDFTIDKPAPPAVTEVEMYVGIQVKSPQYANMSTLLSTIKEKVIRK
jgi:hypothetical protein